MWPDGGPNMILDDGGEATMLVHQGVEYEKSGAMPNPGEAENEEHRLVLELLARTISDEPGRWTAIAALRRRRPRACTACTR
ncbi:S-adenosyl-L-homocysteine hydrolase [Haloechinothrix alba]|uniref:S-adenosyl-L-homocysteine hydrolase n=1 Tax=Haloechinothrix alba TaxID=664784 RepID=A0A238Y5I2_9PSEU|nr:S-adenosyl-L-homocysteine hydrolase [Haloechinothrix alba]